VRATHTDAVEKTKSALAQAQLAFDSFFASAADSFRAVADAILKSKEDIITRAEQVSIQAAENEQVKQRGIDRARHELDAARLVQRGVAAEIEQFQADHQITLQFNERDITDEDGNVTGTMQKWVIVDTTQPLHEQGGKQQYAVKEDVPDTVRNMVEILSERWSTADYHVRTREQELEAAENRPVRISDAPVKEPAAEVQRPVPVSQPQHSLLIPLSEQGQERLRIELGRTCEEWAVYHRELAAWTHDANTSTEEIRAALDDTQRQRRILGNHQRYSSDQTWHMRGARSMLASDLDSSITILEEAVFRRKVEEEREAASLFIAQMSSYSDEEIQAKIAEKEERIAAIAREDTRVFTAARNAFYADAVTSIRDSGLGWSWTFTSKEKKEAEIHRLAEERTERSFGARNLTPGPMRLEGFYYRRKDQAGLARLEERESIQAEINRLKALPPRPAPQQSLTPSDSAAAASFGIPQGVFTLSPEQSEIIRQYETQIGAVRPVAEVRGISEGLLRCPSLAPLGVRGAFGTAEDQSLDLRTLQLKVDTLNIDGVPLFRPDISDANVSAAVLTRDSSWGYL